MRFVNPKNDVAFKKIFGSEGKSEILISFLNAVLGLEDEKAIQHIQFISPYQTPHLETLKMSILDVQATDGRGITYIVEMQIEHTLAAKKRFTYYTAKAYASQIERGEDYPKLNQVIFIGILDFTLFEHNPHYLSRHQILDVATGQQELDDLELNFIELPKFTKSDSEVISLLEKWVYFIKNAQDLEIIPEHATEVALRSAYDVAQRFGWSKADLEAYEYRGIKIQDERGALELARRKAIAQGVEQGRVQGLAQGRQEGLKEGIEQATRQLAQRMKVQGLSVGQIASLTGLSEDEIATL